jgi:cobalt/nickel transport system ATP-binding protein
MDRGPGQHPALLLVGHGSRSAAGVGSYWELAAAVQAQAPHLALGCGFIELAEPDLDTAVDDLVSAGAASVAAVPLVLLGAGHMKDDGPAALARARHRHPGVTFTYGRHLGIHPAPLAVATERAASALGSTTGPPGAGAVVLVGRGSSDPDANADLYKVSRLVWDFLAAGGAADLVTVEPAFVSLAPPSVPAALDRCRRLGATTVVVVPYFLFTGVLVERIAAQAAAWALDHPGVGVVVSPELGPDPRLAALVLERYVEAAGGRASMNCDCCAYRTPLPGHEARVGRAPAGHDHSHAHSERR